MTSDDSSAKKSETAPKPASPTKSEPASKPAAAASEGAAKSEASTPSSYSRGEGQKPVSRSYRDNWNAIYGKKSKTSTKKMSATKSENTKAKNTKAKTKTKSARKTKR
jgi:hypothetical protein